MAKKEKIKKLNKPKYVMDEWGHDDSALVRKINELVEVVNYQQGIIKDFEMALKGRQLERSDRSALKGRKERRW